MPMQINNRTIDFDEGGPSRRVSETPEAGLTHYHIYVRFSYLLHLTIERGTDLVADRDVIYSGHQTGPNVIIQKPMLGPRRFGVRRHERAISEKPFDIPWLAFLIA